MQTHRVIRIHYVILTYDIILTYHNYFHLHPPPDREHPPQRLSTECNLKAHVWFADFHAEEERLFCFQLSLFLRMNPWFQLFYFYIKLSYKAFLSQQKACIQNVYMWSNNEKSIVQILFKALINVWFYNPGKIFQTKCSFSVK